MSCGDGERHAWQARLEDENAKLRHQLELTKCARQRAEAEVVRLREALEEWRQWQSNPDAAYPGYPVKY